MATWKRILVEDDVIGDGIITVTGDVPHTVRLGDPAGLSELTSPVNGNAATADKMLIWDESTSVWKWIDTDNFPQIHLGNSNLTQTTSLRTFDVYAGGQLKFINNSASTVRFQNEKSNGVNNSNVIIGSTIESFRDNAGNFSGVKIEGEADQYEPNLFGIWIESGRTTGQTNTGFGVVHFERTYDIDASPPQDNDVIGYIDFSAPYQSSTGWSYYESGMTNEGGEGHRYSGIRGRVESKGGTGLTDEPSGALEVYVLDPVVDSFGVTGTQTATMLRVDSTGVRVNNPSDANDPDGVGLVPKDYYLATNRGSSGQILHTDGAGQTYWAENIPSTYYNSSYGFVNAELQTLLSYVTTPASFQQIQLNLAQTTTSGVDITEGYDISISTIDNVNADSVTFSGLDETMDNFSVTISGTIEWITYSSAYVQVYCEAVKSDAGNNQQSLFNSQFAAYKQLILPATLYQASSGASAPLGGTSASFTYTVPQIGQINGQPVEDIVFKMYVQRIYGEGNHYFRLSELNISINN